MGSIDDLFSVSAREMQFSAIRRLHTLVQRPGIISFAPGQPSPEMFPVESLRRAADEAIATHGAAAFQYIATRGLAPLVDAVVAYTADKGIDATAARTLIAEGSQQALDLLTRVLVDPGDVVLVELPTYIGALSSFRAARARLVGVRMDDEGIDLEHLRARHHALVADGARVKFLYAMPSFQNPAGVSYSVERRHALLALADELDLLVVEDDPYGELWFGDAPRPPLAALDGRRVIYVGTFSKILVPGLRTGFIVGPEPLLAKLEIAKQAANLCGSSLDQRIVLACLVNGVVAEQRARIRPFYRTRRDALLAALAQTMPPGVTWTRPDGGLFLWLVLPASLDADALLPAAVDAGVAYVPGRSFYVDEVRPNTMRLTFATVDEGQLAEGASRLGRVLERASHGPR